MEQSLKQFSNSCKQLFVEIHFTPKCKQHIDVIVTRENTRAVWLSSTLGMSSKKIIIVILVLLVPKQQGGGTDGSLPANIRQ